MSPPDGQPPPQEPPEQGPLIEWTPTTIGLLLLPLLGVLVVFAVVGLWPIVVLFAVIAAMVIVTALRRRSRWG